MDGEVRAQFDFFDVVIGEWLPRLLLIEFACTTQFCSPESPTGVPGMPMLAPAVE
jgi:hypothetical protein